MALLHAERLDRVALTVGLARACRHHLPGWLAARWTAAVQAAVPVARRWSGWRSAVRVVERWTAGVIASLLVLPSRATDAVTTAWRSAAKMIADQTNAVKVARSRVARTGLMTGRAAMIGALMTRRAPIAG